MKNLTFFKVFKNNKGFTLVETLLYIGIFSILIVILFQLLSSIFDVQLESQSTSSVSMDGRFILNRFNYDIGQATSISIPSLGTSGQTLRFLTGGTTYTYSLTNGNVTLTSSPSESVDQLNGFNTTVSNINFLRLGDVNGKNDIITFSFTLTSKTVKRGGASAQNFRTTIGIR